LFAKALSVFLFGSLNKAGYEVFRFKEKSKNKSKRA